jgi:adenine phosphoribosyltransferase
MEVYGSNLDLDLREFIRDIQDFPKDGILFKDITPLLANATAFQAALDQLTKPVKDHKIDKVVGVESRGFIFAAALAARLKAGLVLVRKPGKLPHETHREEYALEYGKDALEVHKDAIGEGENIWIVDDLLATGGTSLATINLIKKLKGKVDMVSFLIELNFLKGRDKLANSISPSKIQSLIQF